MGLFPRQAGAVSALVGAGQYGAGVLGSALVGAFHDATPWPMGAVMALCGLSSLAATLLVKRRA
jgi:DHA1 family bicyclomycin/chloramphenicol resistance-like MFS transporter